MQNADAVTLHKSHLLFKDFCYDMEILPSYTPIFLIDSRGRIAEKRKLSLSESDFSNIVSITAKEDALQLSEAMKLRDVFVIEASFGKGKDFIVVSKDKYGFSRCVVVSCSDENCTKLHEYFEKLSSYKDYLDSFASLSFGNGIRTPAVRIFKSRMSGALELLRLSENGTEGRKLSFPLKLAIGKLADFALSLQDFCACSIDVDGVGANIAVKTSENFFKLTVALLGLMIRQAKGTDVKIRAIEDGEGGVYINFGIKGKEFDNEMFRDALVRAFRRSGIDAFTTMGDGEINFCIRTERLIETGVILSDAEKIMLEIEELISDNVVSDLYFMTADI